MMPRKYFSNISRKVLILTFFLLLFAILVIEINYVASIYNIRWDLTRGRRHTLTENTIKFIEGIKKPIKMIVFYVGFPPEYLEDMLGEYQRNANGQITFEIIDPLDDIGHASQFDTKISGKESKLIVLSGNERREVDFTDRALSEEEITNAILRLTRARQVVYFLTGHQEYRITDKKDQGLSLFAQLLAANNMETKELLLASGDRIPEDCDVLVVAGPHDFLRKEEEQRIDEFLEQGGDVLFLIEHTVITTPDKSLSQEEMKKNPSLNTILEKWGVRVSSDVVIDLSNHASGDVGSPATRNYMPHKALIKDLDYTFYVRPRSLSIVSERSKDIKAIPFVLTSGSKKNSWGEANRNLIIKFDQGDVPGPVPISAVIWKANRQENISDTRMIVFTDADFLTNAFVSQYSNALMGLNVVNWLSELDYQVFLSPQESQVPRLDLSSQQKRSITVFLVFVPVFIVIAGIAGWVKRHWA